MASAVSWTPREFLHRRISSAFISGKEAEAPETVGGDESGENFDIGHLVNWRCLEQKPTTLERSGVTRGNIKAETTSIASINIPKNL